VRYGALLWVGDEVVGVRTGAEAGPAIVLPAPTVAAGVAWWSDPDGPALIAGLVADLTQHFFGDELVELVLLAPAEARPELEGALGFAVPDVDVRVVAVHEAVTAVLGAPTRVGEWRGGVLLWSGGGDRAVVVGPRESVAAVEPRMATAAPDADFLSAERLVERYAATLEPPSEDEPVTVDNDVQFTVYRPRVARPERTERLVAFAHKSEEYEEDGRLVDPAAEVARLAEEVLGDLSGQVTTTQDADAPIARGDVLRLVPVVPGVRFNPVALEFQWLRGVHREVFEFTAGRELDGQTVTGRLSVYVGLRLVADVTLRIRVDSTAGDAAQEASRGRVYGKVFPSYSHQDAVVVAQIAAAAQTLGHEYLRDVDRLRAGQDWQRELERYIEQADVFQLFWSPASMMSPHVHHEWDYALSLNRPDFVRPVYWQEPRPSAPPNLPPPELDRLHFAYLGALAPAASSPSARAAPAPAPPAAPPGSPAASPRSSRRGVRAIIAGVGTAAVAAVAVTAALTSGGAPSASPPPAETVSASATPSAPSLTDRPATNMSANPIGPPSSEEARAVVVEFFAALDDGDVDAAADLVCADYLEDELGSDLPRLATYSYQPPLFESDEEQGSLRELVVSLTYSDSEKTFNERVRISVRDAFGALICGIAPA
jgi:hypothetical protein